MAAYLILTGEGQGAAQSVTAAYLILRGEGQGAAQSVTAAYLILTGEGQGAAQSVTSRAWLQGAYNIMDGAMLLIIKANDTARDAFETTEIITISRDLKFNLPF